MDTHTHKDNSKHLCIKSQESFFAVGAADRKDLVSFWKASQYFAESIAVSKAKVSG